MISYRTDTYVEVEMWIGKKYKNLKGEVFTLGNFGYDSVLGRWILEAEPVNPKLRDRSYLIQDNKMIAAFTDRIKFLDNHGWEEVGGEAARYTCPHEWDTIFGFTDIYIDCRLCGIKKEEE